jgi:hypothetical protein
VSCVQGEGGYGIQADGEMIAAIIHVHSTLESLVYLILCLVV